MNTRKIAITAVSIAIVFVLVSSVAVPIPATGGFTHAGAIAEVFIALAFGPIVGLVAAGVGAALADLYLGFGSFAPLTLIAHGALGGLCGYIGWKKGYTNWVGGWIVGGLALVIVYFVGEATVMGFGVAGATAEVPFNLFQVALGGLGLLLLVLVKRAYPQIETLAEEPTYTEADV